MRQLTMFGARLPALVQHSIVPFSAPLAQALTGHSQMHNHAGRLMNPWEEVRCRVKASCTCQPAAAGWRWCLGPLSSLWCLNSMCDPSRQITRSVFTQISVKLVKRRIQGNVLLMPELKL